MNMDDTNGAKMNANAPALRQEFILQFPYKLATGALLDKVTLRRPKVRDLKAAQKRGDNPGDVEVVLVSLICEPPLTPEDIDDMDHKDYAVLQGFLR